MCTCVYDWRKLVSISTGKGVEAKDKSNLLAAGRAVFDLFEDFKWVKAKVFFGELLGHVITLRGPLLASRTGDDRLALPSHTRVSIKRASDYCT